MPNLIFALILSVFCLQNCLYSDNTDTYIPLYAGTILAFFPENVDPGCLFVQPYLYVTKKPGFYDENWSFQKQKSINELSPFLLLETGITKYLDISLFMNANYNQIGSHQTILYDDTEMWLGFQILRNQKDSPIPDLRIILGESFPTGKYKNLNPKKLLSDSSGSGCYETFLVLVTRKIFYFFPRHPFNLNLNLQYTMNSKANVEGFNVYGGAGNTNGQVKRGNQFLVDLAIEYSFTRHWVVGMDIQYIHNNKSTFSGNKGILKDGTIPYVGLPSSEQIALAPSLEYNFNENFGVIIGTWFTVTGRNAANFLSGIMSVYYEF